MKSARCIHFAILATFFISCAGPQNDAPHEWVRGVVYDLSSKPLSGVSVSLTSSAVTTTTDSAGAFNIDLIDNKHSSVDSNNLMIIDTLVAIYDGYISKEKWLFDYTSSADMILWEAAFRLADNEAPGWIDRPDLFISFDTTQLYTLINGGAILYIEHHAINGIFQAFNNGANTSCDVFIYNCVNRLNADSLFNYKANESSATVTVPGFDQSNVIGSEFIGGAIVYAHWNKYYLEISLSGYNDLQVLKNDATHFLSLYSSKIGVK